MNLKHYIPIAVFAVALCLLTSCKKTEENDLEPTRDVEVEFDNIDPNEQLNKEKLQKLITDTSVRYVYLTAKHSWDGWTAKNIEALRPFLQKRIEMSPKIRGRGDFDFKWGEASKVPEDSLWFVKNGWTINKNGKH